MGQPADRPRRRRLETVADRLVILGRLVFEDFCLLEPRTLCGMAADPDWPVALANAPHVELAVARAWQLTGRGVGSATLALSHASGLEDIQIAQSRLVRRYALEILREKAPALYDCLPWHEWDFATVATRLPVWRTRFLLAGTGTAVTMCRIGRSAGVYVVEPLEALRTYVARKAESERIRRLVTLEGTPESIPLPAAAVDLAIVGGTGALSSCAVDELLRVAQRVLVIDNDPFSDAGMPAGNWQQSEVRVRGLGSRACWWLVSDRAEQPAD